jgi:hypothetical protein
MLRWLTSPLAGTAGVIAGLCLISIPLRQLTSAPPVQAVIQSGPLVSGDEIPAVLRLKLLAPAKSLRLETGDGRTLLDKKNLQAGDSEHDAPLRLTDDECDIILVADFGDHASETAVFLTVMPDGLEERTRHATGSGVIEETLRYEWRHAH